MARRVAIASMTVLASSGIGLVAAPMAFGQIVIGPPIFGGSSQGAQVTNAGSASANTGGNAAVGNASTNNASVTAPAGGLLDVPISLGAPTNNSTGEATVTSGAANATGNSAGTNVGQSNASGNQVGSFLAGQHQSAGVTNAGSAGANTGGNTAIGNASQNTATVNQNVGGGLLGVGVNLGGPTNNSTGQATVNSGAANAAGNTSDTNIGQSSLQGGVGGPGALLRPGVGAIGGLGGSGVGPAPCPAGRFGSFQNVNVRNEGQAQANTGNNVAIGNASTNNASTDVTGGQTVSGGLLGVGLTIGGPVNNSTGTAVINTGPATAVGNDSVTTVGQVEGCPQVATITAPGRPGVIVPVGHQLQRVGTATLARTGLDTGDLGMIAGALLGA
ncbi:MAG TPA: hypothetical protein VM388_05540, partial [Acidimicrobiales bacterium]|nr:hypothetical protein [Acidimicrobiales bacterium]